MYDLNQLELSELLLNKLKTFAEPEKVLDQLKITLFQLEEKHGIQVVQPLIGGTSAFVAKAKRGDEKEIIIKIPFRKIDLGVDFANEMKALKFANGNGYVQLLDYDEELKVAFLENLGQPLGDLGFSNQKQLQIICTTLQASWVKVKEKNAFPNTLELIKWFSNHINDNWGKNKDFCSQSLIQITNQFIKERTEAYHPEKCVLVHGDAHNYNVLQDHSSTDNSFKLIDPDGILAEPAYDLGVLMREFINELSLAPITKGLERLNFLSKKTGVGKTAIWQWGLIQCVATGLVYLAMENEKEGQKFLQVAELWKTF